MKIVVWFNNGGKKGSVTSKGGKNNDDAGKGGKKGSVTSKRGQKSAVAGKGGKKVPDAGKGGKKVTDKYKDLFKMECEQALLSRLRKKESSDTKSAFQLLDKVTLTMEWMGGVLREGFFFPPFIRVLGASNTIARCDEAKASPTDVAGDHARVVGMKNERKWATYTE